MPRTCLFWRGLHNREETELQWCWLGNSSDWLWWYFSVFTSQTPIKAKWTALWIIPCFIHATNKVVHDNVACWWDRSWQVKWTGGWDELFLLSSFPSLLLLLYPLFPPWHAHPSRANVWPDCSQRPSLKPCQGTKLTDLHGVYTRTERRKRRIGWLREFGSERTVNARLRASD